MERTDQPNSRPSLADIYVAAARAAHLTHCTNCREAHEAHEAQLAECRASMRRRDRHQLDMRLTPAVTA